MKTSYKSLSEVLSNPINRNLIIIFIMGFGAAVAIVTTSVILLGQL
jgi:hypothetical protein